MPVTSQLTIDCADPDLLARFWAEALHYVVAPPPEGHASWDDFYRSLGVPEDELGQGSDRIVYLQGKDRWSGSRWCPRSSDQEPAPPRRQRQRRSRPPLRRTPRARRGRGGAAGRARRHPRAHERTPDGMDHYAVAMLDPEGNEFDVF